MHSRREFVGAAVALGALGLLAGGKVLAQSDAFDTLLRQAINDPSLLEATRTSREGFGEQYESRAIAPRTPLSSRAISEAAITLITTFEVTDRARYEAKFQQPIWPAGESGVTIGIGYDLGYVTADWLNEDWEARLADGELATLRKVCGLTGEEARDALAQVRDVAVSWDIADQQFRTRLLPRYVALTLARLPNTDKLSDDSLGALVSLVYNRGASFRKDGPRYREMRMIRQHMVNEAYDAIPAELRAMARLWTGVPNMRGLVLRRELEAALFERGLKSA
jgi:GH24 family phage-related lysozyme (muramidase)